MYQKYVNIVLGKSECSTGHVPEKNIRMAGTNTILHWSWLGQRPVNLSKIRIAQPRVSQSAFLTAATTTTLHKKYICKKDELVEHSKYHLDLDNVVSLRTKLPAQTYRRNEPHMSITHTKESKVPHYFWSKWFFSIKEYS